MHPMNSDQRKKVKSQLKADQYWMFITGAKRLLLENPSYYKILLTSYNGMPSPYETQINYVNYLFNEGCKQDLRKDNYRAKLWNTSKA